VDGDGYGDWSMTGDHTWILPGSASGALDPASEASLVLQGFAVAAPRPIGDLDGDGADELYTRTALVDGVIGIHVVRGGRTGVLDADDTDAVWETAPYTGSSWPSILLAAGGDADGDGIPDLLATDPHHQVFWLPGATLLGP
jgi:hypothetical protein